MHWCLHCFDRCSRRFLWSEQVAVFFLALLGVVSSDNAIGMTIKQEVDVFVGHTTAPWGTTYFCHRIPSAIRLPTGTILAFAESRVGSCEDAEPPGRDDITMKKSTDSGRTWGQLTRVVAPANDSVAQFSARNPYPTVDIHGRLLLGWVNSTAWHSSSRRETWQRSSTDEGVTWSVDMHMGLGALDGSLLGPGQGIVLGRHAPASAHRGRIVVCGATGYGGAISGGQSAAVWTSDDNGASYQPSTGSGAVPMPFKGLAECQIVELRNGSVLLNLRNELGPRQPPTHLHRRAVAISHDGGSSFGSCVTCAELLALVAPIGAGSGPFIAWCNQSTLERSRYNFAGNLIEPTCSAGLINFHGSLFFSNP